jgi:hypothetical protein
MEFLATSSGIARRAVAPARVAPVDGQSGAPPA